ncbi:MAG: tRNA lysidine(34) synthetase TilS [Pseudomonadota bacterium]
MNNYTSDSQKIIAAVKKTIQKHQMLSQGDSVVVGVSGGPDSVALLHLLYAISQGWPMRLGAVYLNHGLRQQANQEADMVAQLAERLGIPYEIGLCDVRRFSLTQRLSIQEAAREARYAFYQKTAAKWGFQKVALGHQLDDQAESVLLRLFRGSGTTGLAGIPPVRDKTFIRPLIETSRATIISFLEKNNIHYMTDESNSGLKYLRNRIRKELIPEIVAHYNPKIAITLGHLADILRDEEKFWEGLVARTLKDLTKTKTDKIIALNLKGLMELHPALKKRVIRAGIQAIKGDLRGISFDHVKAIDELTIDHGCPSSVVCGQINLPKSIIAAIEPGALVFYRKHVSERKPYQYIVEHAPSEVFISEIGATLKVSFCSIDDVVFPKADAPYNLAFLDYESIRFPLLARNFEPGDHFIPLGMTGSQKVKNFFINEKVPKRIRGICPIVLSEDKIIWIGGYRLSDLVKIKSNTKKVVRLELIWETHCNE